MNSFNWKAYLVLNPDVAAVECSRAFAQSHHQTDGSLPCTYDDVLCLDPPFDVNRFEMVESEQELWGLIQDHYGYVYPDPSSESESSSSDDADE